MILSVLILIFGASRGSFLSLLITIIYLMYKKLNFLKFSTILIVITLLSNSYFDYNSSEITIVNRIFNPRDSDVGAAESRLIEVDKFLVLFLENPSALIFGNGLSSSSKLDNLIKADHSTRIHNTPFSVLFDTGVFGFLFFIYLLFIIFKYTYRKEIFYLAFLQD